MAASRTKLSDQIRQRTRRWMDHRAYEFSHCSQCDGEASPMDPVCPHCGQANPCRVAPSVGIYLAIAVVSLAAIGVLAVQIF